MKLSIKKMNKKLAAEILQWKYEKPYDLYNNEVTEEAMQELLDGGYQALFDVEGRLFGYFCIGKSAQVPAGDSVGAYDEDFVDMGLGMNPSKTGQGNGFEFCRFILNYIENHYPGVPVRLTVATFNHRAVHLYEKLGFVKKAEFSTDFADFMTMVLVR